MWAAGEQAGRVASGPTAQAGPAEAPSGPEGSGPGPPVPSTPSRRAGRGAGRGGSRRPAPGACPQPWPQRSADGHQQPVSDFMSGSHLGILQDLSPKPAGAGLPYGKVLNHSFSSHYASRDQPWRLSSPLGGWRYFSRNMFIASKSLGPAALSSGPARPLRVPKTTYSPPGPSRYGS